MTERIIEIAEQGARLKVRHGVVKVRAGEDELLSVPPAEVACLVLAHPYVSLTQPVLAAIAEAGGSVVVTDTVHRPVAMMLPLDNHTTQATRFRAQAGAKLPLRKRLWQQIVRAKIRAQARVLREMTDDDQGLAALVKTVRSGDPTNVEAQAARRYWPALFGVEFRRRRDGEDLNRHLNYGYAVLRALVARALCATGLHPTLSLHHHHRNNAFALADDLMEPYRPLVDRQVVTISRERGHDCPMDREAREWLLSILTKRFEHEAEMRTLFDLLAISASSLAQTLLGERAKLELPEV